MESSSVAPDSVTSANPLPSLLTMDAREFRALLDWFMCSDPWPVSGDESHELMMEWIDRAAKSRGYKDWVEAYHRAPSRV
jgi:hypothetical protein